MLKKKEKKCFLCFSHLRGNLPSILKQGTSNMGNIKEKRRKFRLQEILNNVPYSNRKQIRDELILLMEVSESTFDRILYANEGDKQDISATNLVRMTGFLGIKPEELFFEFPDVSIGNIDLVR